MRDSEEVQTLQGIIEDSGQQVVSYGGDTVRIVAICYLQRDRFEVIADLIDACQGDIEKTEILSEALRHASEDSGRLIFSGYVMEANATA